VEASTNVFPRRTMDGCGVTHSCDSRDCYPDSDCICNQGTMASRRQLTVQGRVMQNKLRTRPQPQALVSEYKTVNECLRLDGGLVKMLLFRIHDVGQLAAVTFLPLLLISAFLMIALTIEPNGDDDDTDS
jgi:hypothetical protein